MMNDDPEGSGGGIRHPHSRASAIEFHKLKRFMAVIHVFLVVEWFTVPLTSKDSSKVPITLPEIPRIFRAAPA